MRPRRLGDLLPDAFGLDGLRNAGDQLRIPTPRPSSAPNVTAARLSDAAIDWGRQGLPTARVADEQMSALLMAIVWRGMDRGEIARWAATARSLRCPARFRRSTSDRGPSIPPARPGDKNHAAGGAVVAPPPVAQCPRRRAADARPRRRRPGQARPCQVHRESSNQRVREQLCDVRRRDLRRQPAEPADARNCMRCACQHHQMPALIASSIMSKKLAEGAEMKRRAKNEPRLAVP